MFSKIINFFKINAAVHNIVEIIMLLPSIRYVFQCLNIYASKIGTQFHLRIPIKLLYQKLCKQTHRKITCECQFESDLSSP